MPKKGLTSLSDYEVDEVSVVGRGANRKKRFPVTKAAEANMQDVLKAVLETETDLEANIEEVFKTALSDKGKDAMRGAVRLLNAFRDEMPDDVMSGLGKLLKFDVPPDTKAGGDMDDDKPAFLEKGKKLGDFLRAQMEDKGVSAEEMGRAAGITASTVGRILRAEIDVPPDNRLEGFARALKIPLSRIKDQLPKEKNVAEKNLEGLDDNAKAAVEHITKSLTERIEKAEARAEKAEARAETLGEALATERNARVEKEMVEKAANEFAGLGDPVEVGAKLHKLHKLFADDKEGLDEQLQLMKTASERVLKSALLSEAGGAGGEIASDAWGAIEQKGEEIRKAHPDLSKEQAIDKAITQNPGLYRAYQAEKAGAN